jgi:hypothetical protein
MKRSEPIGWTTGNNGQNSKTVFGIVRKTYGSCAILLVHAIFLREAFSYCDFIMRSLL